jgi:hypothetical protein
VISRFPIFGKGRVDEVLRFVDGTLNTVRWLLKMS